MTDEAIIQRAELTENSNNTAEITEDQVALYLQDNSDFFLNRENILLTLKLPHQSGGAVSLVERQVSILRDRNIDLRNRYGQLIETATDNDRLFELTNNLVLTLMEAGSLVTLIEQLQHSLEQDFKVDRASLILFDGTTQDLDDHSNNSRFARVEIGEDARLALAGLLQDQQNVCGPLREKEANYLFGANNNISSAAIIPLYFKGDLGILAVGSNDINHFQSDMGTLFISHVSKVLSRLIRPYLITP